MGTLVVVKPAQEVIDIANDPISIRLKEIPFFHPIFLNKEKLAWTKEGERARQQIDPSPLLNTALLYQTRVRSETSSIVKRQNELTKQIKGVDRSIGLMVKSYTDRQRKAAKQAERFSKLNEFAHLLAKCQAILNACKHTSQLLNQMLPEEEQLEPFSWAEDKELAPLKPTS
jgi:mevalonate kinase